MPLRWSNNEELQFINSIKKGMTFEELSIKHNRSISALELRLKKIIYDNIVKGKSKSKISSLLNINITKLEQYYNSYVDFLKSKELKKLQESKELNKSKESKELKKLQESNKSKESKESKIKSIKTKFIKKENKLLKLLLSDIKIRKYIYKIYKNKKLNIKSRKILDVLIKSGIIYTL
jgi:hypothetical protein